MKKPTVLCFVEWRRKKILACANVDVCCSTMRLLSEYRKHLQGRQTHPIQTELALLSDLSFAACLEIEEGAQKGAHICNPPCRSDIPGVWQSQPPGDSLWCTLQGIGEAGPEDDRESNTIVGQEAPQGPVVEPPGPGSLNFQGAKNGPEAYEKGPQTVAQPPLKSVGL